MIMIVIFSVTTGLVVFWSKTQQSVRSSIQSLHPDFRSLINSLSSAITRVFVTVPVESVDCREVGGYWGVSQEQARRRHSTFSVTEIEIQGRYILSNCT